ncbi:MAG TPA: DUF4918 family protein [Saprospiraceae bacterium]|nr:DUF4918 family protein [Saprospiraceae bacterium]HMQ84290.1 DUF4918 family protein [Saprospiraceae bacterium]
MTLAEKILHFNRQLRPDWVLPEGIELLFPYDHPDTWSAMGHFYHKYYGDEKKRALIFGINPGRFGAGVTGVPFTDPIRLLQECQIENPFDKKPELSSEFVYEVVNAWGGVAAFYRSFYITSLCPLGFTKKGKNYNYYDDRQLEQAVEPHIIQNIEAQLDMGCATDYCACMGQGQNLAYFTKLNEKKGYFKQILSLPHPRWVMQYRRKQKAEWIAYYVENLGFLASAL